MRCQGNPTTFHHKLQPLIWRKLDTLGAEMGVCHMWFQPLGVLLDLWYGGKIGEEMGGPSGLGVSNLYLAPEKKRCFPCT